MPQGKPEPDNGAQGLYQKSLKRRPRTELASEYFFRPLAHAVVVPLAALRVKPTQLVVFHTLLGCWAGWLIAQESYLWAAVLIQIKTVLDNADGQLARATNQVTETGRYLDTEGDFIVNLALFLGLGSTTGQWVLAGVGFVALTALLSLDFNWEYLYRKERNEYFRPTPDTSRENQKVLRALERFYEWVFLPQDRWIRGFCEQRFARCYAACPNPAQRETARLAYFEAKALTWLANLELSTQLAILGLCLVLGAPMLFLVWILLCGLFCLGLQWWREQQALRVLGTT